MNKFCAMYSDGNAFDCKVLVYAKNSGQARLLAYPVISEHIECSENEVMIIKLKNAYWLPESYNAKVVENPENTCTCCGSWWKEIGEDGLCSSCHDDFNNGYIG